MSSLGLYEGDFRDWLPQVESFKMLFADPPDNIGLKYDGFEDKMTDSEYEELLDDMFIFGMSCSEILWVSYNAKHINLVGSLLRGYESHTDWDIRHFVQTFTFGYCVQKDFQFCFRPMVRVMRPGAVTYEDSIRIRSARQEQGDKRANPAGKIPPDVWEFTRVTGNSRQRRKWHRTQLNEDVYKRALGYSAKTGDRVGDLFAGTGTIARASAGMGLNVSMFEKSPTYCEKLAAEFELPINRREQCSAA